MAKATVKALQEAAKVLQQQLQDAKAEAARWEKSWSDESAKRREADAALKESREHFADLKQRLHAAETSNQFMRGYLARVHEDDAVREDLLTIGEPEGEQRMVPKRKPTEFPRPDDFTMPAHHERNGLYEGRWMNDEERRRKAKHWITY